MTRTEAALKRIDAQLDAAIDRLFAFLRIPSISADPAYAAECDRAAEWIAGELRGLGCDTTVRKTPGRPMVVAHYTPAGANGRTPHVLFYGHYDVQPADPLELWHTPPFEPQRRKNKKGVEQLVGRGTSDDKGQVMTFVEAARALIAENGALPIRATFLIEGEEEVARPRWCRSSRPMPRSCLATWRLSATLACGTPRPRRLPRACVAWCMRK